MPKQVDHDERRSRIAAGLIRVVSTEGLEAVSLRRVAASAGVSPGQVQHYFPSKDAMVQWAMQEAASGFEVRMTAALGDLGPSASARDVVAAVLSTLLPDTEESQADGRVALAFMARATTRPDDGARLEEGAVLLRAFLAAQLSSTISAQSDQDAETTAVLLLALVDGLAAHVLSSGLPSQTAHDVLNAQLDQIFDTTSSS